MNPSNPQVKAEYLEVAKAMLSCGFTPVHVVYRLTTIGCPIAWAQMITREAKDGQP